MQCQPRKRHKRLGTAIPEHFHSPATAIWIPQLHLRCSKHRSRFAALALHQGATKVLGMGPTRPYRFPELSLLPNPALHCLCTYQGLPWSYHGGLLHNATLCIEDLPSTEAQQRLNLCFNINQVWLDLSNCGRLTVISRECKKNSWTEYEHPLKL